MSDGLRYVKIQSIGNIDIYQVSGNPAGRMTARKGSLAIPDNENCLYRNTDGGSNWEVAEAERWIGQTMQSGTDDLKSTFSGVAYFPLDLTKDAVYRVKGRINTGGFKTGSAGGMAWTADALIDVTSGTVTILGSQISTDIDAVTPLLAFGSPPSVAFFADNVSGGYGVRGTHNDLDATLDWLAVLQTDTVFE